MNRVGWLAAVVVSVGLGVACGDRCVNGETRVCTCDDAREGAQLCRSDGVFDPCRCSGPLTGTGGGSAPIGGGSGGGRGGGSGSREVLGVPNLVTPSAVHIVVGDPLVLSVVHDAGELPLTWNWRVRSPDGGVGRLDDAARDQPLFNAQAAGDYLVEVSATSDAGSSTTSFPVRASTARILPWEPTSIAMNPTGDRLAIGRAPLTVEVHDLVTGSFDSVLLTRTPLALAFTPDGTRLVVGQDAQLQVISLTTSPPQVTATWPIGAIISRMVATDTGVHAQSTDDDLHWLRLETGQQTMRVFSSPLSSLELHPDGARIYGVETRYSGSSVYRLGVHPDGGIANTQSKYFSGTTMSPCGGGWLSRSGDVLFTACGNLFRTAPGFTTDLVYGGQLPTQRYVEVRESFDAGLIFGLAQPQLSNFPARYGPPLVLTIDGATLRQNSIAPQPDTSSVMEGRLDARWMFVDAQNRVHVFLVTGEGIATAKTFWLIRTVGDL